MNHGQRKQLRYDSQADGALSQCVIHGATNGHSDFCSDCAKTVKKTDLSNTPCLTKRH